jgi:hypothetical protein
MLYNLLRERDTHIEKGETGIKEKKRWRGLSVGWALEVTSPQGSTRLGSMSYFSCFGGYQIEKLALPSSSCLCAARVAGVQEPWLTACLISGVSGQQVPKFANTRAHGTNWQKKKKKRIEREECRMSTPSGRMRIHTREWNQARARHLGSVSPFVATTFRDCQV